MHFALVTDEYCAPYPTTRGTAIQTWSIACGLLQAGHSVTAIIITDKNAEHFAELQAAGVTVRTLPFGDKIPYMQAPLREALLSPRMETFYPWVALAPAMGRLLDDVRPDAVLAYNLYNLAATHGIDAYPRMCVFVDLDQMVAHYRWLDMSRRPVRPYLRATLRRMAHLSQWRFMKELLAGCQSVVNFAAHHTEWLRARGFPRASYIPPPTRNSAGPEKSRSTPARGPGEVPRVLLIGHLGGIATISGMRIFLKHGLPRLEERLGIGTFEVHVVGDYSRHLELAEELKQRPSVRLRGYVEDVDPEFLGCDVLLVPTPINLGTRTRVIEGFSYGCCIVSHSANALGIPQLVHEKNGLLADDGAGMGDQVARALTDAALRGRLRADARRTFEEVFSLETAGAHLAAELAAIARPATAR